MDETFKTHSRAVNIGVSVVLGCICLVCYILLILLFIVPQSLRLRSLIYVSDVVLKPTVVVGFLSAILTGATSALVTRAAEHSLWLRMSSGGRHMTTDESHRLAQWSVSPWGRLLYLWNGYSWPLRLGGIVLFATAIMNPILLSGISPLPVHDSNVFLINQTENSFAGYFDRGNSFYNGGNFRDNLMTVAALAQMTNVSAPSSSVCTSSTCSFNATAAATQAVCNSSEQDNPNFIGQIGSGNRTSQSFCSEHQPDLCVSLVRSNPATFANFSSLASTCESNCPGDWAVIFGAYVNINDNTPVNVSRPVQLVDCQLSFGNVTVLQQQAGILSISPNSFNKSSYLIADYDSAANQWRRVYRENSSEYTFVGNAGGGNGANSLYGNAFASYLLNYGLGQPARTVADKIERNFDMATLFAFARAPNASTIVFSETPDQVAWEYNPLVLLILLLPLVATVSVLCACCRIGDDDVVVGYNPVEISKRGPISLDQGLVPSVKPGHYRFDHDGYDMLNVPTGYTGGRI